MQATHWLMQQPPSTRGLKYMNRLFFNNKRKEIDGFGFSEQTLRFLLHLTGSIWSLIINIADVLHRQPNQILTPVGVQSVRQDYTSHPPTHDKAGDRRQAVMLSCLETHRSISRGLHCVPSARNSWRLISISGKSRTTQKDRITQQNNKYNIVLRKRVFQPVIVELTEKVGVSRSTFCHDDTHRPCHGC